MIDVQKIQKIKYNYKTMIFWIVVLTGMCVICELNIFWLNIANLAIGILVCFISNRKIILNLPKTLKRKFKGVPRNENTA